jgi:glycerophosphoryl diester phosphodiesterase
LRRATFALVALLAVAGCATPSAQKQQAKLPVPTPQRDLAATFDCLRSQQLALVAAHRTGPAKGFPENSVETMLYTASLGVLAVEMDIVTTADGAQVLLHDDTLERTTTGTGKIAEMPFSALKDLVLEDDSGAKTPFGIPSLARALEAVKEKDILAQLDVKRGTPFSSVLSTVARTGTRGNVIVITYNTDDAITVHQLDPEVMISVSIRDAADIERLEQGKVDLRRVIAFVGTRDPDPALLALLKARGIEAIQGTLGRPGQRLDDQFLADGNGSEYAELALQGVALISASRGVEAHRALIATGQDGRRCWTGGAQ